MISQQMIKATPGLVFQSRFVDTDNPSITAINSFRHAWLKRAVAMGYLEKLDTPGEKFITYKRTNLPWIDYVVEWTEGDPEHYTIWRYINGEKSEVVTW